MGRRPDYGTARHLGKTPAPAPAAGLSWLIFGAKINQLGPGGRVGRVGRGQPVVGGPAGRLAARRRRRGAGSAPLGVAASGSAPLGVAASASAPVGVAALGSAPLGGAAFRSGRAGRGGAPPGAGGRGPGPPPPAPG